MKQLKAKKTTTTLEHIDKMKTKENIFGIYDGSQPPGGNLIFGLHFSGCVKQLHKPTCNNSHFSSPQNHKFVYILIQVNLQKSEVHEKSKL